MLATNILAWGEDYPDAREQSRLALVALATEIAVLASLMDQDLAPVDTQPGVADLQQACRSHGAVAVELLSPDTRFEELQAQELQQAIDAFHARLRDVQSLRAEVQLVLEANRAGRPPRGRAGASLRAGAA